MLRQSKRKVRARTDVRHTCFAAPGPAVARCSADLSVVVQARFVPQPTRCSTHSVFDRFPIEFQEMTGENFLQMMMMRKTTRILRMLL